MSRPSRGVEYALFAALAVGAVAFLVKTPYLSVGVNSVLVTLFLAGAYGYARTRLDLRIPIGLLALVFAALQVDALGNFFHLYTTDRRPIRYDEFAHLLVQALMMPMVVWLAMRWSDGAGLRLPRGLTTFVAATTMFGLSALYEVIELWDEVWFGGHRIWSFHDTAEDLQWDLCGIVLGTVLATWVLRVGSIRRPAVENRARAAEDARGTS